MNSSLNTDCPNCFYSSPSSICPVCAFDSQDYLDNQAAAHHLPLFTLLNEAYKIGRVLGESRSSIVYSAIRLSDQHACVIKEYYPHELARRNLQRLSLLAKNNPQILAIGQQRFRAAAELLRNCDERPLIESGVVQYIGVFNQNNTTYLAMERLNGLPLAQYLTQHSPLISTSIILWLIPLLETLQRLHSQKIYHRNINLNNIFLVTPNKPVLMDFGLIWPVEVDDPMRFSSFDSGYFSAPEQFSSHYCDQRTDLYALGAVIYCCLHGYLPPSIEARRQGVLLNEVSASDELTQTLANIAEQCLQLDLEQRPQRVGDVIQQLNSVGKRSSNPFKPLKLQKPKRGNPIKAHLRSSPTVAAPVQPVSTPESTPSLWSTLLRNVFAVFFGFILLVLMFAGTLYAGFIAYQKYDLQEIENRKKDNLLFSKAKNIEDYQRYLQECVSCESKLRAKERIASLAQEQQRQAMLKQQQQHEAFLINKAQTVDDFRTYLKTCVVCADKARAEVQLAELIAAAKLADEQALQANEKAIEAMLTDKGSSAEFYQQTCPKNFAFWQRTAQEGYANAQLFLGSCYRSGDGVKQDYIQTLKWYGLAAEQGNIYAEYNLGVMYQNGYGVRQNYKEAVKWYRKAAAQGHANAQYLLGLMYEKGDGVDQDYKEALAWYLKAATQDNAEAQYQLGTLYHFGSGVTQDYQAALNWYHKAAEQNNPQAQYLLGVMYQNGYGVSQDNQEAMAWYQQAADQGNAEAAAQLKVLEAEISR
jgi:TPR repeat protein/serine/threonine protein kinase